MKKQIFYVTLIVVLSFASLLIFNFLKRDDDKSNGFNRKFRIQQMEVNKVFELPPSILYIAGTSATEIYFKDLRNHNTSDLFALDYSLSKLKKIDIKFPPNFDIKKRKVSLGVLDTIISVTDNKSGELTMISRETGKRYNFIKPNLNLDQTILFSKRSISGRTMKLKDGRLKRYLVKLNYATGKVEHSYELPDQGNESFSTDGLLKYDVNTSRLFYSYFYRGEFLCLDTNLSVLYTAHTIDTIRTAKIKMAKFSKEINQVKETMVTQNIPPKGVNRNFAIYKRNIYIISVLRSDNESASEFRNNQVVDVYSIDKGLYSHSFYIPKYKRKKLREFMIKDNFIFAIFDTFLVKFKLEDTQML